jgi:hypothetical protein
MTGNELGNKYALAALRQRRAELLGEAVALEQQARWKRSQLEHLDATLVLFGIGDPNQIKAVKPYKRIALFKQGELSQAVRDALRRGGRPMRLSEVVDSILADLGQGKAAVPAMRHRVRASLNYLEHVKKAVVKSGRGAKVMWSAQRVDD